MTRFRATLSETPTPPEAPSFVQTPPLSSFSTPSDPLAPPPLPEHRHSSTTTPQAEAGTLEDTTVPAPKQEEEKVSGLPKRTGSRRDPYPRFHDAVARISALHKVSGASEGRVSATYDWGDSGMGAEPGLDASKATLDDMKDPVKIQVVDWSAEKVIQRRFEDGDDFLRWFEHEERKGWVKARWINCDGLNWEVAKAIALRFELHPLALEDALKVAAHSHSKVDWYPTQLFTRVLIHSLSPPISNHGLKTPHSSGPFHTLLKALGMNRTSRHARDVLAGDLENAGTFLSKRKKSTDEGSVGLVVANDSDDSSDEGEKARDQRLEEQLAARAVVESLTEKFKVPVEKQQLSTFLLPSGTIISIFTRSGESLTSSIFQRLDTPGTLLRSTEDCSMLLQALLDVVVDEVLELTEEFRRELDVLEGRALVNPDTTAVRHLHVLSGQLLMLKRTLTPLQGMMVSLRHDDEKRTIVARRSASGNSGSGSGSTLTEGEHPGFISPEARLYLSDVNDHIDSVLTSLSLFSKIADSIVDFIFNSLSFASNESMKWLTMFSIVFLPLSFLVGYYGMNFQVFPDIGVFPEGVDPYGPNPKGGLSFFWTITGPVIAVLVGLLFVMNFGSWIIGFGRRMLHRAERHKHRKIIRAVRKTRRKQKTA